MKAVDEQFINEQFITGVKNYLKQTTDTGLWESESWVFKQYVIPSHRILDIGCGTGRTTFALFQLGYENIMGIDLTPEMIKQALKLNEHFSTDIPFEVGNVKNLNFQDDSFDVVIFSFNGLMSIPRYSHRLQAVKEMRRILRPEGLFIFTTHDRDAEKSYLKFWKEEQKIWDEGRQDKRLYEFGDLITPSKNEKQKIFIHIPDQTEVQTMLKTAGFKILESFYRSEKFDESREIKKVSGECRFWIAQKNLVE